MSTSAAQSHTTQSVSETIEGIMDRLKAQADEDRHFFDYINAAHDNVTRMMISRKADTGLPKQRKELQKCLKRCPELREHGAAILSKAQTDREHGHRGSRRRGSRPTTAVSEDLKTEFLQWRDEAQAHLTVPEPRFKFDRSSCDNKDTAESLRIIRGLREVEFYRIRNCKAMANKIRRLAFRYRDRVLPSSDSCGPDIPNDAGEILDHAYSLFDGAQSIGHTMTCRLDEEDWPHMLNPEDLYTEELDTQCERWFEEAIPVYNDLQSKTLKPEATPIPARGLDDIVITESQSGRQGSSVQRIIRGPADYETRASKYTMKGEQYDSVPSHVWGWQGKSHA